MKSNPIQFPIIVFLNSQKYVNDSENGSLSMRKFVVKSIYLFPGITICSVVSSIIIIFRDIILMPCLFSSLLLNFYEIIATESYTVSTFTSSIKYLQRNTQCNTSLKHRHLILLMTATTFPSKNFPFKLVQDDSRYNFFFCRPAANYFEKSQGKKEEKKNTSCKHLKENTRGFVPTKKILKTPARSLARVQFIPGHRRAAILSNGAKID